MHGVPLAVCAVGLYVDPKAAKRLLSSKQADISSKQGIPEQGVFDGMLHRIACSGTCLTRSKGLLPVHTADLVKSHDVEKSLRMVISFGGVNQKNFWSALEERLEPSMKKVSEVLLEKISVVDDSDCSAILRSHFL